MRRRTGRLLLALAVAALLAAALLPRLVGQRSRAPGEGPDLSALLSAPSEGFAPVQEAWELRLPEDHGAHPGFRSELWYLTGHLREADGAPRYGFALALYRLALAPSAPERASDWAATQVYRAHFTLTDPHRRDFRALERTSRAALRLAGASLEPVRVWLEDWSLEVEGDGLRLRAGGDSVHLDLVLDPVKPALSGDEADLLGGPLGGDRTFHFYVLPRVEVTGTLRLEGEHRPVRGLAGLNRAWGEVPLSRGQLAMDRLGLHLDDGRDLVCLHLHRRGGGGTPIPRCLVVAGDGTARGFGRQEVTLEPRRRWESPGGARYPVRWRLAIEDAGLDLEIEPVLEAQELDLLVRAWSGAIRAGGTSAGVPVEGWGHLELTGYGGPEGPMPRDDG